MVLKRRSARIVVKRRDTKNWGNIKRDKKNKVYLHLRISLDILNHEIFPCELEMIWEMVYYSETKRPEEQEIILKQNKTSKILYKYNVLHVIQAIARLGVEYLLHGSYRRPIEIPVGVRISSSHPPSSLKI
jgi:hypothetical protein